MGVSLPIKANKLDIEKKRLLYTLSSIACGALLLICSLSMTSWGNLQGYRVFIDFMTIFNYKENMRLHPPTLAGLLAKINKHLYNQYNYQLLIHITQQI